MSELADRKRISWSFPQTLALDRTSLSFYCSALAFRVGLALVTFEQDRPFGMMLSDYCFFLSLLLLFTVPSFGRMKRTGIVPAALLILAGALLSLVGQSDLTGAIGPLARLFVLFGLFAPLAVIHCRDIRQNLLFFVVGIAVNCAVTIFQAWAFPGIVAALSINPQTPDQSEIMRYQGLTQFPVTLGLAAAVAVLIAIGLLLSEKRGSVRWALTALILICIEGALLSGSRTFFAALVPSLIVLGLMQDSRRRIVLHAVGGGIILLGAVTYFFPGAMSQFSERVGEVGLVDYGRLAVAAQALIDISQKPILGWGVNHFAEAGLTRVPGIAELQGVHVTLLQYWYGAGLLGAIGFLTLFIIPVRRMLQVLREPANSCTNAVRLMLACYLCFFIVFNLGPYLYNRYLYLPMFVFAGFAANVLRSLEATSAAGQAAPKHASATIRNKQSPPSPGLV